AANDAFVELGACMADGRILSALGHRTLLQPTDCDEMARTARRASEITVGAPLRSGSLLLVPLALPLPGSGSERDGVLVALTPVASLLGIMASARLHDATTVVLVG